MLHFTPNLDLMLKLPQIRNNNNFAQNLIYMPTSYFVVHANSRFNMSNYIFHNSCQITPNCILTVMPYYMFQIMPNNVNFMLYPITPAFITYVFRDSTQDSWNKRRNNMEHKRHKNRHMTIRTIGPINLIYQIDKFCIEYIAGI